jgi:hypothetical protein
MSAYATLANMPVAAKLIPNLSTSRRLISHRFSSLSWLMAIPSVQFHSE